MIENTDEQNAETLEYLLWGHRELVLEDSLQINKWLWKLIKGGTEFSADAPLTSNQQHYIAFSYYRTLRLTGTSDGNAMNMVRDRYRINPYDFIEL